MDVTSTHLKCALMHYFRYKRQWICADEVRTGSFLADILIDSGKWSMEIEIKISKYDLIQGEDRKRTCWGHGKKKHDVWTTGRANKFALCVPEELSEIAEEWIEKTNPKYGLYVYNAKQWLWKDKILTIKSPKLLHDCYGKPDYKERILKRLSSCRAIELETIMARSKK